MNRRNLFKQEFRNQLHTFILVVTLLVFFAFIGGVVLGQLGIILALGLGLMTLLFGGNVSPQMVLRMYRARELTVHQAPQLYAILQELTRRAGLRNVPRLYYVPTKVTNAFAVGSRNNAAIGITDGLLRKMDTREMAGVLAHEMAHVQNNDMRVMGFADLISRVTGTFASLGQILFFINLVTTLFGAPFVPWLTVFILMFAPTVSGLLMLALSRTREFDADLDAVRLTQDPAGLATALTKLEFYNRNFLQQVLLPGNRVPQPSLFRTHPPTEQRIKRLRAVSTSQEPWVVRLPRQAVRPASANAPVQRQPRWHVMGLWY